MGKEEQGKKRGSIGEDKRTQREKDRYREGGREGKRENR